MITTHLWLFRFSVLLLAWLFFQPGFGLQATEDILIADFEGDNYGEWKVTGEAFGAGPARGTLPNQKPVTGFLGRGLVNTYRKGDGSQGTLTSPDFKVERRYINFLVGGGFQPGDAGVNLLVEGKVVRAATGRSQTGDDTENLEWANWDAREFIGKAAQIQIVDRATGGWGHINVDHLVQSDTPKGATLAPWVISANELYNETYRPQFHFTARSNWHNDPNGLVFYLGEYHLFFQHNPFSRDWGNMTWGHAVSPDLVHWRQLDHAIYPDKLGTIFSGSAVMDWNNTAGFQSGPDKTLVCIYTAAGGTSTESKGQPFTQCIAYSNDRGRTFTKYAGNPVLKNVNADNRDPKVIWHEPTKRWVMALYVPVPDATKTHAQGKPTTVHSIQFFASPNLKEWTYRSRIDGFFECPDLFELPVDGDAANTRWVVFGANGDYAIGRFDGREFHQESGRHKGDWGRNFYAAQTYSDIPASDGRRILIGWMNGGKYPGMPFNQQMTFPCELTLRTTPEGLRLFKRPVREITLLYARQHDLRGPTVRPGENPLAGIAGELFDLEADIEPGDAETVGFEIRGSRVVWSAKEQSITALGRSAPLPRVGGRIKLRLLVDRASLEVFGHDGAVTLSSCYLPLPGDVSLACFTTGAPATLRSLQVRELKSIWR